MNRPSTLMPRPAEMAAAPEPQGIYIPHTERAVHTVQLDTEAFLMPDRGMAEAGQALERTGSALTDLRLRQLDAIAIRQEAEADGLMEDAALLMRAEADQQPDETRWGGVAASHIGKVRERIAGMGLSRKAEAVVQAKLDRWAARETQHMEYRSIRQSFRRTREAIGRKEEAAIARGDTASLHSTVQSAAQAGYYSAQQARQRLHRGTDAILTAQQQQQRRAVLEEAAGEPDKFLAAFPEEPAGMDPALYTEAATLARKSLTRRETSAYQQQLQSSIAAAQSSAGLPPRPEPAPDTDIRDIRLDYDLPAAVARRSTDPAHLLRCAEDADLHDETARELVRLYALTDPAVSDPAAMKRYKSACLWLHDNLPPARLAGHLQELDARSGLAILTNPGTGPVDTAARQLRRLLSPSPESVPEDAYQFAAADRPVARAIQEARQFFAGARATVSDVLTKLSVVMPPDQVARALDALPSSSHAALQQ